MSPTRSKSSKSSKSGLTYEKAGVSIREGDALAERLAKINPAIGGFSGEYPLKLNGIKQPVLLASTDSVGTKVLVAIKMKKFDTVGIDCVAMVANDLAVCGAKPIFFLDYYATGKLKAEEIDAILSGYIAGCEEAGAPLIGGETAEMPGVYGPGDFDLVGFCVGLGDKKKLVDGSRVKPGDVLIGLASSGVHSNGFSLVRAITERKRASLGRVYEGLDAPLGEVLLRPTRIYVKAVEKVLKNIRPTAMAHITGGGLPGNVVRVLPEGTQARIDPGTWQRPPIFGLLQKWGDVSDEEMYKVFNMGIGYVIICRAKHEKECLKTLKKAGETAWRIGTITEGERRVVLESET